MIIFVTEYFNYAATKKKANLEFVKIKKQFIAEVEFGILSKNCKNFGICSITPLNHNEVYRKCKTNSLVSIISIYDRNKIDLDLMSSKVNSHCYKKFLATGEFLVQERYQTTLEDDIPIEILPGLYEIEERSGFIKIKFRP